ncbi:MAG: VOC family protein [Planctomycetota bacterium]|jgi:catechol 2,3-dioxygenase-like lactoylglutathione lyase family enzyme
MTDREPGLGSAISFVTLGVTDLARSRAFYAAMGLEAHPRSNEHVVFHDLGGQIFALFPRAALAEDAGVPGSGVDAGLTASLSVNVSEESEVEAILQRAERAGGRITRPASTPPWGGVRGYFADPDGFAWEIAWNPSVALDGDGRVRL